MTDIISKMKLSALEESAKLLEKVLAGQDNTDISVILQNIKNICCFSEDPSSPFDYISRRSDFVYSSLTGEIIPDGQLQNTCFHLQDLNKSQKSLLSMFYKQLEIIVQ